MADQPDYYELLGVSAAASSTEIDAAYKSLAKTAHPDAGGNAGLFRLVKLAYDTLRDPLKRAEYDRSLGDTADLGGLTDPLDLLTLGQRESERGDPARARSAFCAVIAAGPSEWTALAWLGLAGTERDLGNLAAAHHAYGLAADTGDPGVVPAALVGLGDVERDLEHHDEARRAYQQAIATGDEFMLPSALFSLGELEEALGNMDAARAAYYLTSRIGDAEFAQMAADALDDLARTLRGPATSY